MGGGASLSTDSPNVDLVDFTNREKFLQDCSVFFDTMQGSDGTAAKKHIYCVLNGLHHASEILNIFMLYCPEGRMSEARFVDLCRDIKQLEKKFTSENALAAYAVGRKSYYHGSEDCPDDVNFAGFLYHIVPELAIAKGVEEDLLIDRLARHHMPSPSVSTKISFRRTLSAALSPIHKCLSNISHSFNDNNPENIEEKKEGNDNDISTVDQSMHHVRDVVHEANRGLDMDVTMKHQAALIIQSKFRCRIAKRVANNLKQIKKGKRIKDAAIGPKLKPKLEKALKNVFQFYCPNDDIDREGFFALLRDGGLLNHNYLGVDVEYNFRETIAKVELPDTPRKYNAGVRYHKRFTFMVFKEIALCFVSLSTGLPYDAVVDRILQNNKE